MNTKDLSDAWVAIILAMLESVKHLILYPMNDMCDKEYPFCGSLFGKYSCRKIKNHDGPHMSMNFFEWTEESIKKFDFKYEFNGPFRRHDEKL